MTPQPAAQTPAAEARTPTAREAAAAGVPAALVLVGLAVAGFAARLPVTSTSAELPAVVAALGGSGVLTGLVSALPPLVFAAGSVLAGAVIARVGTGRTLLGALAAVVVGLLVRVAVVDVAVFLVGTVVALAGIALANVALPTAVKRYLPTRTGLGTAVYTLLLALGTAVAAATTVPLGQLVGGWRVGLGAWAVVAAVAVLPWAAVTRRDPGAGGRRPRVGSGGPGRDAPDTRVAASSAPRLRLGDVARTRVGRAVAVVFAGQASSSYVFFAYLPTIAVDAGSTRSAAGLLLGWFSVLGVLSSVVPLLAGRLRDQRGLVVGLAACWVTGDLGLAFAPGLAWLWATAAGIGASLFTLALALIPLRSATEAGSAALSAFSQGVAYLVSAVVVFAAGLVQEAVGSWTPVLVGLAVLMVPVSLAGLTAGRDLVVEDG